MRRPWWGGIFGALALTLSLVTGVQPASALDPKRSLLDFFHRTYGSADGLPSGLTTIAQTPDGYLWVGSTSGLYRFDGVRFEPVASDQLLGPSIIGLAATSSGDLWIGYDMGGGVSRLRNGRMEHFKSGEGGPEASINNIRVSDDGTEVFTHGAYTVWRMHDGKWARILQEDAISQIELARGGVLWAKSRDKLYYCRPNGGACRQATGYGGGVTGLTRDAEGRVWTSDTKAGGRMYRVPDVIGISDEAIPGPEYGASMPSRLAARIFIDSDGALWGWNSGEGVLRMRSIFSNIGVPGEAETFTEENGLTSNIISRFFEDREGSIWVSTRAGLDQFRPANVVLERAIPSNVGVAGYSADNIGEDLYVQANVTPQNSGPVFRVSKFGSVEKILDDVGAAWNIIRSDDGTIWINGGGIPYRLSGNKLALLNPPPDSELEVKSTHVAAMLPGPNNTLLVWLWNNGAWQVSDGIWRRNPTMPTTEQLLRVELVRPGRDGAIWMSHYDPYKLYRHQDGRFASYTDADVGIGSISNVTFSADLEYLAGEHGIAAFDGKRFHALASNRVLSLTSVRDVAAVGQDLWVVSQAGIMRFNRDEAVRAMHDPKAPPPAFQLFTQKDGLPAAFMLSSQSPAENIIHARPDGRVYFLTGAGVVWIDPSHIVRNQVVPPVVIRNLRVNGRAYESPSQIVLPPGSENLEIDYAALSFIEQSRVQFRYMLDGVDKDWVDPGDRREAVYTRLEPGSYTFRVKAANDAGVWNEKGATLSFTIEPTFLQSIWFKLIVAALLIGVALLAYAWRVKLETGRIRRQFEVRTAERERIARELHDTLLQGVQGLVLRVQSAANALPAGDGVRSSLEQTLDRADVVLRESRDRVRDLRVPSGNEELPQLLVESARRYIAGDTPQFRLVVEGASRALLPEVQEEALRITEEAIRNAATHAQASVIEAIITYKRSGLGLLVRDDGVGMGESGLSGGQREGHYGLVGMKERAERIGGTLVISSRERAGVEVVLSIPANKAYAAPSSGRWRRRRG